MRAEIVTPILVDVNEVKSHMLYRILGSCSRICGMYCDVISAIDFERSRAAERPVIHGR